MLVLYRSTRGNFNRNSTEQCTGTNYCMHKYTRWSDRVLCTSVCCKYSSSHFASSALSKASSSSTSSSSKSESSGSGPSSLPPASSSYLCLCFSSSPSSYFAPEVSESVRDCVTSGGSFEGRCDQEARLDSPAVLRTIRSCRK